MRGQKEGKGNFIYKRNNSPDNIVEGYWKKMCIPGESPRMKVDNIQLTKGSYGRTLANYDHARKTEMIQYDVIFLIRMKVTIGSEQIEVELPEEGNYTINVRMNQ